MCSLLPKTQPSGEVLWHDNHKLLAIKLALEEWRHWLEGAAHPFVLLNDHKNLQYLREAISLNPHQTRWALFFTRFEFTVSYKPGSCNIKADTLSPIHASEEAVDEPEKIIPTHLISRPIQWILLPVTTENTPATPPGCPPGCRYVPQNSALLSFTPHTLPWALATPGLMPLSHC